MHGALQKISCCSVRQVYDRGAIIRVVSWDHGDIQIYMYAWHAKRTMSAHVRAVVVILAVGCLEQLLLMLTHVSHRTTLPATRDSHLDFARLGLACACWRPW